MSKYNTGQRKMLLDFMTEHKDNSFTIEEIFSELGAYNGAAPGLSTLYRLMPELIEEGLVKRFSGDKKRRFLYQLVGGEQCGAHLHMKCTGCGKLLHMSDGVSEALLEEIKASSNFSVDRGKTVLFGECEDCRENRDK